MIKENLITIQLLSGKSTETRKRWSFINIYARQWMSGVLILTDLFSLFAAILLGLQIRAFSIPHLSPAYDAIFTLLAIILVLKFYSSGLYPAIGLHYIDELRKLFSSVTTTFVIVMAVTFLLQTSIIYSRLFIILTWMFSILFIPIVRYLMRRFLIHLGIWGVPVVIIGKPEKSLPLAMHLRIQLQHGIRPELIISDDYDLVDGSADDSINSLAKIKESTRNLHIHDALILVEDLNNIDMVFDRYRFLFNRVILIKDQTGNYGLNTLRPLDFGSSLGLELKNHLLNKQAKLIKRFIDVLASILGILLVPLLSLMAVAIKLDSPGGIFYRQTRLGKGGKTFQLLKFRTMYINAEDLLESTLAQNLALKKEWDCYQKLKDDPRITRIGRFLRKFSLDELPQLWNIVRGEMSLIGPRPFTPNQHQFYGRYYKDYIQVLPGITGWWQVSGRNQTSFIQRAELDNEYIQRWSLWMDIFILVKTIKVILWQDSAY